MRGGSYLGPFGGLTVTGLELYPRVLPALRDDLPVEVPVVAEGSLVDGYDASWGMTYSSRQGGEALKDLSETRMREA